jgi:hypothetical protein
MSYADLEERKSHLIRKALKGSAFIADITAPTIASLTDGTTAADIDLAPLPEGYDDLGWLTEEGMPFGRDVSQSDITSFGSTTPTRTDVVADTSTLTVIAQETKARTIGLSTGADMAAIKAAAITGEVRIDKPDAPAARHYRVLALAVDTSDTGKEIYIARYMPRAKVTGYAAQTYAGGDTAITWGTTFTAFKDSTLGFSESWLFGGPGWLELLDDMGIEQAA